MNPDTNLCVGCKRTIEEISKWGSLTTSQRLQLMEKIKLRKDDPGNKRTEPRR
jgi:predicted Fe-S protein YdhL (DUF1289 family)